MTKKNVSKPDLEHYLDEQKSNLQWIYNEKITYPKITSAIVVEEYKSIFCTNVVN